MANLFELERLGFYDEAADRCLAYAEKFPNSPHAPMLLLREAAYRELLQGYGAVEKEYKMIAAASPHAEVKRQAEMLAWFHDNPSNALACALVNGPYKLYLDGKHVLAGDHPLALSVARVEIGKGPHVLTAELAAPNRPGPLWFMTTLRTATANVTTDDSWEETKQQPADWPLGNDDNARWRGVQVVGAAPFMSYWQFVPNAFVDTQSGSRMIRPEEWEPGNRAYLRKRFVVPEEPAEKPAGPPLPDTKQREQGGARWLDKTGGAARTE